MYYLLIAGILYYYQRDWRMIILKFLRLSRTVCTYVKISWIYLNAMAARSYFLNDNFFSSNLRLRILFFFEGWYRPTTSKQNTRTFDKELVGNLIGRFLEFLKKYFILEPIMRKEYNIILLYCRKFTETVYFRRIRF